MGYGNAVDGVVMPCPFGWAVVHTTSEIVLGFVAGSSCIRVSRHQNLRNAMNVNEPVVFLSGETGDPPKRGLTITYVLALPLDYIQDMQNTILGPILVKDTIQYCILRQYRRERGQQVFPYQSGP